MLEESKKAAQEKIDKALFEVSRLETVASELKKTNEAALIQYQEVTDGQQSRITDLAYDESIAVQSLSDVRDKIDSAEQERASALSEVKSLKTEILNMKAEVANELTAKEELETSDLRKLELFNKQVLEKESELQALDKAIASRQQDFLNEEADLKAGLARLNKDLESKDGLLIAKKIELEEDSREVKQLKNLAADAERSQGDAEKATLQAQSKLEATIGESKVKSAELAETKSQLEVLKVEVKQLTIERFNSKNFMEELRSKESNLKKRYEEVGLEYKQ